MRKWVTVLGGGLALTIAIVVRLLVFPTSDPSAPTDAVILLAGAPEARLPVALRLAEEGPGVLAVSAAGGEENAPSGALCDHPPSDITVYCFAPAPPNNTRTEARSIGQLVEEHGWTEITVVTSTFHMHRAGMLIRRCTDAEVEMVEARPVLSGIQWGVQVLREVGGLTAALTSRSC